MLHSLLTDPFLCVLLQIRFSAVMLIELVTSKDVLGLCDEVAPEIQWLCT